MTATANKAAVHVCMYTTYGHDNVAFFKCQRTETRIFRMPDGGWVALCAAHASWAAALGCRP